MEDGTLADEEYMAAKSDQPKFKIYKQTVISI